jgi:hypothetical protein
MDEPSAEEEAHWPRAYAFVLCFFMVEILLLYLFTVRFS